jgi:hypothetical protein
MNLTEKFISPGDSEKYLLGNGSVWQRYFEADYVWLSEHYNGMSFCCGYWCCGGLYSGGADRYCEGQNFFNNYEGN